MAIRSLGYGPVIATEGEQTNPADDQLMADSGAMWAGVYEARVTVGASAVADFAVQRRNSANDANVGAVPVVKVPAAMSCQYVFTFQLHVGERVRVVMDDGLTGVAVAVLNLDQVQ